MKTLIVYYSFTHNNEMLAKHLQEKLQCDIHKIETIGTRYNISILFDLMFNRTPKIKPHRYLVSTYDQCIFVGPIWAGKIASPMKTFMLEEKYHLSNYSFITVCGGSEGQKEKVFKYLTKLLEQEPSALCELWINDLLAENQKNTIKYTSGYRLQQRDLDKFEVKIAKFLNDIQPKYSAKSKESQQVG